MKKSVHSYQSMYVNVECLKPHKIEKSYMMPGFNLYDYLSKTIALFIFMALNPLSRAKASFQGCSVTNNKIWWM